MDAYGKAKELIDAIHSEDPQLNAEGKPHELVYADGVESWVRKLVPEASPILCLAARCQHLERWAVPRSTFPEGKAGYFAWRKSLYTRQAERARDVMFKAGIWANEALQAMKWIAKKNLPSDAGSQALEDAACLVFLENEIGKFASDHADYPREKFVDIIQKTWKKMSPKAREFAGQLNLPEDIAKLVGEAIAPGPGK